MSAPILQRGGHLSPDEGMCLLEYVSVLTGEAWSESPRCTHPVLAAAGRSVNDALPDDLRQDLMPLAVRLAGTADLRRGVAPRVLSVRLAAWCARQVLYMVPDDLRASAEAHIRAGEVWAGRPDTAMPDPVPLYRSAYSALAAYNVGRASTATTAAMYAVAAITELSTGRHLISFFTGLLDEYDRLTHNTEEMS